MARPDADVMGQPVSQRELTADIPYWIDVYCLVSSFTCSEMTDGQERVSYPILERLLVNDGCSCDLRSDNVIVSKRKGEGRRVSLKFPWLLEDQEVNADFRLHHSLKDHNDFKVLKLLKTGVSQSR